ncbi:E3 ubiquitin/ISG15 ligase TRIM25-like [Hyperolius riggenbachi]|uniref:E3 ubiquitin/ISG15 ligase TRIM25-like n=1 Tax=Hyperolius riggenbachi TaxID=752182 RepID=UPI0035A3BB67
MASSDLREDLHCSVCLSIYTDPVTMRCGHNFCKVCIDRVLDTQKGTGHYFCPECRASYRHRPAVIRNVNLRNVAERFSATDPDQDETGITCTYCIHFPVPAVKSCLLCEASMCDKHLKVHSKTPEHVMTDPTTSLGNRKCSIHQELLKYFCTVDAACVCASCRLDGEHQGHQVEMIDEASEKKKNKLRYELQKLITQREVVEKRVEKLSKQRKKTEEEAACVMERVTALFRDIKRQLEDLERKVLSEVFRQEEKTSLFFSDKIQMLEIKKDELSKEINNIEKMCNMSDPLTVLLESDTDDLCDIQEEDEETDRCDKEIQDGDYLGVPGISYSLHTSLFDMIKGVNVCFSIQNPADISLDIATAGNSLSVSADMKTASWSDISQTRPETPVRFQEHSQVLSSRSFSSLQCFWDVNVKESVWCRVGMCYPTIDRRGSQSRIGDNNKSWCLDRYYDQYSVRHNNKEIQLPKDISTRRFRVYLDYEAGLLSFYELCDPIRHLHTFAATFTEPLHAALWVWYSSCVKISGVIQE